MTDTTITVRSLKYDQQVRRTWNCELIERTADLICCVGVFDSDIKHPGLGNILRGTVSYEYYWLDRWYNIFRFHEPDGSFRNFYCNVAMPALLSGNDLTYVDLDIDVIAWQDLAYEVHDIDDFEKNRSRYGYPDDVIRKAEESLAELKRMVEACDFPFDSVG